VIGSEYNSGFKRQGDSGCWIWRGNWCGYGTVEIIFWIVSGFSIAFSLQPDKPWMPQGATLVGCAYVIARGMNNVHEAKPKPVSV
jgi:hypothetical protein